MELPERQPPGHEQAGRRPCVVLADPAGLQRTRFPVLVLAPLTGARQLPSGPLYIRLEAGVGGLPMASTVLLDQVAAIDARRVKGYLGQLEATEYVPIEEGLRTMFRL
ncbi:MAG: type II toxin-antitoxin system PemK/MazF family toxin [Armatimonadetes bacterium]|nr:type II toxin-antitoxin system PemK/MazF family toxin [Armatimonadota bacterium]